MLTVTQTASHFHLLAKEILEKLLKQPKEKGFAVVGVILPDVAAAFVPGHTVYSNGEGWITVEELCKTYRVTL